MRAIAKLWPWAKPHRRYMFAAMVSTVVSVGVNLIIPLQTARVIDDGILARDGALVRQTILIMVGLILFGMVASAFSSIMAVRFAFHTVSDLRRDLYNHTQDFSYANLDRLSTGEILIRLTSDIAKVLNMMTMGVSIIAQTPLMFFGALLAIVILDASLAVVLLFMIPTIGLVVWYVLSRSGALYGAVQSRLDRLNTVLQENIQGIEVVKAFVRQDFEIERFDNVADDLAKQATTVNQLVASLFPTLIIISSFGVAGVVWLGGNNVIDGRLSEGNLVAFISYLSLISFPLIMFAFVQPMLSAAGASMVRITDVLSQDPDVRRADEPLDLAESDNRGDICFTDVSFSYRGVDSESCEVPALENVSLHIPHGTTVAILGATGSGKSTLVHLIPRLYDATSGTVEVGGVNVRRLSKTSLRRSVGIALQEPQLFTGSVMENLRYGRPDATDAEVIAAAKAAQADEFITEMEAGYDSRIEQGGANLSGGQRQRISIARTLLVDPAILILDDSTSAVDLDTEAHIQDALRAYKDRTVVLVAQRISTALGADWIVVLDRGHIKAIGTHDELLGTSEIYTEIYRSQLGEPAR